MSLTREIGHQNTKLDRGKGEIGDGSVSIHIAREKTPPTKKKSTLHRDGKGSSPRWCRRVRFATTDCFLIECERVVGRQSDFGFPFILLGGFSERENDTGHRRTSFSLSTASKAARPVLVDRGRPSPPREPPLVTLPLGWPNNRLNMMMMAKALFLGNFVRRFVPGVDTKKDGGGVALENTL